MKAVVIRMTRSKYKKSHLKRLVRLFLFISFLSVIRLIVYIHRNSTTIPEPEEEQFVSCEQLCPYVGNFTRSRLEFGSTYFVHHHPEFVCPSNFRNLADWVYGCSNGFNQRIESTTKRGQIIAPCLPNGSIIYVGHSYLENFFNKIYPHLINNFVLVTGEGDTSSPNDLMYLEQVDSKIIHWFGQNGQIDTSRSNKFTHIPIGINCHEMAKAIQGVYAHEFNNTLPSIHGDIDEPSRYIQPLDRSHQALDDNENLDVKKLLLINFDWQTDQTRTRRRIWKDMCHPKKTVPFATCLGKIRGVKIQNLPDIYARNRQYSFWLSPRGGGIDCHRTWEALYLDIIPIVWNSTLNVLYEDLPVLIIQNHMEITETFLRQKLREISIKKHNQTAKGYRFDKLRNAHWRRLILSKSRHSWIGNNVRTGLCWRARINVPHV